MGGLVAIPTDTVYGLAADPFKTDAVDRIYEAKGRPENKPVIILLSSWEEACKYAYITKEAEKLARAFWPGALTIILKKKPCVSEKLTSGGDTVGLRCPGSAVARAVIEAAGGGVGAPSANLSGRPSPSCAEEVLQDLDGRIDAVVDGGRSVIGIASTIVDLTEKPFKVLREETIKPEEIASVFGEQR
jgi:L-threonylcarbamoyladenylate synthase